MWHKTFHKPDACFFCTYITDYYYQNNWKPDGTNDIIVSVLTCLLLCEGDVGVHQAPSDAVETMTKSGKQKTSDTDILTVCLSYLMFRPIKLVQVNI